MTVFRIDITSWTASFRYPNLISGVQPTLEVPPLSTILGILNAASGQYLQHRHLEIGYYFEYEGKTFDLETIYMIPTNSAGKPSNEAKSNVIQREFMGDAKLSLYFKNDAILDYLRNPYYDILLGRSGDLAKVSLPQEIELTEVEQATKIKGQIVPLQGNFLPGKIQALPKYFTDEFPRNNIGTEPYTIIPYYTGDFKTNLTAYRDPTQGKRGVDIYFHDLDLSRHD
ncbi:MAG: type I-B CRISPR-associated protein Cas5 [Saprospiraceae bacterium]|nr:type I-B CRISPR-associated protein Cas5 [Saprospiraceae bacterium]